MGASKFLNNVSKDDLDNAKINRDSKVNQPDFPPGQGDDDIFADDFFNAGSGDMSGGGFESNFGMGAPSADPFLTTGGGVQQPTEKSDEDKIFEILTVGFKGVWKFTQEVVKSFDGLTPKFWSVWGTHTAILGSSVALFGLVIRLFGAEIGLDLVIGGILTTATGVLILMLFVDSANGLSEQYINNPRVEEPPVSQDSNFDDFSTATSGSDDGFDDFDDFNESSFDTDSSDSDFFADSGGTDGGDFFNMDDIEEAPVVEKTLSNEEALNSLDDIKAGMYTRQYLYDAFVKKLDSIKPDFSKLKPVSEESDTFYAISSIMEESAKYLGVSDDNMPVLEQVDEDLFSIRLKLSRVNVKGFSVEKLADEMAKSYAFANLSSTADKSQVFGVGTSVGAYSYITIFTGEKAMISLKDIYGKVKDFVLDPSVVIPVIVGVDSLGKPIFCDFKNIESILVAGLPRKGKTWLVLAIITQMCAYMSPKELNFYIGDRKEGISDFKPFTLPHVKKFAVTCDSIVSMLDNLVNVEGARRKKLIGDANFVNIWDFKERYPDVELPIIYVILDEMVTLADEMDKETKAEFQGYISKLITQLPALGIKAIMIPHVIKDEIIKKRTSSLIQCRVSVCGDENHILDTTGASKREFQFKLQNRGDCAVRMPDISQDVMFTHSVVLTKSNSSNANLFDYMRRVWTKIEPDSVKDSVSLYADNELKQSEILSKRDVNTKDLSFEDLSSDGNNDVEDDSFITEDLNDTSTNSDFVSNEMFNIDDFNFNDNDDE